MKSFVGRHSELAALHARWESVQRPSDRPGQALLVRGRRRVGKSRLVEEFLHRHTIPHFFYAAAGRPVPDELRLFAHEAAHSTLPGAHVFAEQTPTTWDAALALLVAALSPTQPAVVVLDELPYLIERDPGLEGSLQRVFDRQLSRLPVLLIGVGSHLGMMEALDGYGRPFHQRATTMLVPPLTPADVAQLCELPPAEAIDVYLVTGGLPLIVGNLRRGETALQYVKRALADPTSPLLVSGERALVAEVPAHTQPADVLSAVGSGERTHTAVRRALNVAPSSLSRSLTVLTDARLVAADVPLSTKPSRETRYRVECPYLRFWLQFMQPGLPHIERGRGDLVMQRVQASWASWRGRAVEPVVREALSRRPELTPPGTAEIGGYWTRTNDVVIDLVGADRAPVARSITMVGSVKWRDNAAFDGRDARALAATMYRIPGAGDATPMLAVSRMDASVDGVRVIGAGELLDAWRQ